METELNESQRLLKTVIRDALEAAYPLSATKQIESSEDGFSRDLFGKMAELGWLGLGIPEKYGGTGGDVVDLALLYEELGRALAYGPHFGSAIVCGQTILAAGSEKQKLDLLPRIARGEIILAPAFYEHQGGYDSSSVNVAAKGGLIKGTKVFVPYAGVADFFICPARTTRGSGDRGITLYAINSGRPGITRYPLPTFTGEKQSEVTFDISVSPQDILGKSGHGWAPLKTAQSIALLAQSAEMVGGAEKAMEMTVDYAKQRVQFGRPIGAFQAVQHKCAEMKAIIDAARFITYRAASKLRAGETSVPEVAMAKALGSRCYRHVTKDAHQIFGGIGFTMEHDINRFYRRVKAIELNLGDVNFQTGEVARLSGF